jgi:hypothetical protein
MARGHLKLARYKQAEEIGPEVPLADSGDDDTGEYASGEILDEYQDGTLGSGSCTPSGAYASKG